MRKYFMNAAPLKRARLRGGHAVVVGNVDFLRKHGALANGVQFGARLLQGRLVDVPHNQLRPGSEKPVADRQPNALRAACHDSDTARRTVASV